MIARVVVPIPLDKAFDYTVPEAMQSSIQVGSRVVVPFGRRILTGLVVELSNEERDVSRLKAVSDVLDTRPSLTEEMLTLTRWIADYYMCGWGEVIRATLPSGIDFRNTYTVHFSATENASAALNESTKELLHTLRMHDGSTLDALQKIDKTISLTTLRRLEQAGYVRLESALKKPAVRVKKARHLTLVSSIPNQQSLEELKTEVRGPQQHAVLHTLYDLQQEGSEIPSVSETLARSGASSSTVKSLEKRGMLRIVEKEVLRTPLGDMPTNPPKPPIHTLHTAQVQALERIHTAIAASRFETFLLHGVTGSGKTEVYIAALKDVQKQGKTGIVLVPEISLTPQTVTRFRAHFGDVIAVLHSRMSPGERYDAWRALRSGRFPIVIGPRSAILAPLENIGLIIVDEEHEGSYKQFDPAPRYHARDVAVMRASMNKAVCILGSATPSLESFSNARIQKKYTYLSMPERVPVPGKTAAPLPAVRTIDLTLEKKKKQLTGVLSKPLKEAIGQRLAKEEQIILLQNRRGYSSVLLCQTCGWSPMCDDCAVTLTYHKVQHHLRCHYCGKTQKIMRKCGNCGGTDLSRLGAGTQRVEEEIEAHFPTARLLRMDLDTTSTKNAHHKILSQFERREADILIGTQMVAKGLDFGRVTLVGVINADAGMLLPDFRADERTFQLLTQVAGRAGRASRPGEVLLQTRNPQHPVLQYAINHNYELFAKNALEQRNTLQYPPFGRLVRIEFKGPEEGMLEKLSGEWARHLPQVAGIQVLGPQPALISKIQKQYRFHVILKASKKITHNTLRELVAQASKRAKSLPKGYRMAIDIDAVSLF